MKSVLRQFGWVLLLVSCAAAQDAPAVLQGVKVTPTDDGVQVDVSLSDHVQPTVLLTTDPNRLVLDFPNTTASAKQERITVNANGVSAVRYSLHSANPAVTRVVVDLDAIHPYKIRRNGTIVSLDVGPAARETARVRQVPPAAATGGLLEIFHRRGPSSPHVPDPDEALRRPIPGTVPAPRPVETAKASAPSPAHPNRGSLQEGTVFPGMGTPGTGEVPVSTGGAPQPARTAASASTAPPSGSAASSAPWVTVTPVPKSAPAVPATATEAKAGVAPSQKTPEPTVAAEKSSDQKPVAPQAAQVKPETSPVTADQTKSVASLAPSASQPAPAPSAVVQAPAKPKTPPATVTSSAEVSSKSSEPVAATPAPAKSAVASTPPKPEPSVATTLETQPAVPVPAPNPPVKEEPVQMAAAVPPPEPIAPIASTREPGTPTPEVTDPSMTGMPALDPSLRTVFKVKYVADGVVYLDGGRSAGLAEGMKLAIKDSDLPVRQGVTVDPNDPRVVAELQVTAVAETSAVTDIEIPKRPVKVGDLAYLSNGDTQALIQQRTLSPTREFPVVIAFTEGDPLDEEVRKEVPRPPLPSVNRARGRIGFDYMGTVSHGTPGSTNSDIGMVLRTDVTRIYGTYWNLSGYWRGRLHSRSASSQPTLQDLINRTYHLQLFYDNPSSRFVAGVGRMYLPWAPSLDTIDGGYFGVKMGSATAGFFAGSTPDPTSWSYNPDRRMTGAFINFQGGDYDQFHYTSTSGVGVSALKWQIERPFLFLENSLSYKRYLSIYDSLQADSPRGNPAVAAPGPGLSRNFLTVRVQVHPRVELDFNHNYLRDVPTYDPTLVGTGLLDKYLFQGASVGTRIEVAKQVFVYANLGSSNRSGDAKRALNELYGLTFAHLPWWGLRADAHYSRFNSAFADGSYRSISIGRNMTDDLRLDILVGDQNYTSTLAASDRTRFVNATFETAFGPRYFLQGGFTINRGETQNYDQWLFTFGYRFDSKARR